MGIDYYKDELNFLFLLEREGKSSAAIFPKILFCHLER